MSLSAMSGRWFRSDIEGIRGLAMVLVLVAHAGFGFGEGGYVGLDLFFVISGFLITTLLLREFERRGTISIGKFYARRIRRLLPAAALVLAFVVVMSQVLFSPVRNELIAGDVLAAVGYFVNWRLAGQSVDYFAGGFEASPVQHFWSLAVEEQFYLVWPLAMLAILLLAVRFARPTRGALALAIAAVGLISLLHSAQLTPASPGEAYLSTLTRVWELALGAFLAVVRIPKLGDAPATALTWLGLGGIGASFLILDEATPFPGTVALIPTLGAAAIIVAGSSTTSTLPMRGLGSAPLQYMGRISYCWYLWHWPFLIFAGTVFGPLSAWGGGLVVLAAWVPAELTRRFVEQPVLRSDFLAVRPRRALTVLAAGSGTTAIAAVVLATVQPSLPLAPAGEVEGAQALKRTSAVQARASALRPEAAKAFEDRTRLVDDGCFVKLGEVEQGACAYGEPDAGTTVVLFGDSHGEHYFPALEFLAKRNGWRLVALTKSFCSPAEVEQLRPGRDEPFTECEEWRERTLSRILGEERPRLVVVGGSISIEPVADGEPLEGESARRALVEGFEATLRRLRAGGAQIALLTDVPKSPIDVPECVAEHPDSLGECTFPAPGASSGVEDEAAAAVDGAHLVDTLRGICAANVCRGVIGDAIVYRDRGHLTATFAATLAPLIGAQLPRVK
jgi:peptidoglycan/LPS O-acetylase OafA/YrhL